MISQEQVKHIAKLARLKLTDKEVKKMQKELGGILDYIGQLEEVDVSSVEPTAHSANLVNIMREDEAKPEEEEVVKDMTGQAPEREGEYVKTKAVLN